MSLRIGPRQRILGLTPQQTAMLQWLHAFITDNGYSPTIREIGEGMALSTKTVQKRLRQLEERGRIHRAPGVARSVIPSSMTRG